MSSIHDEQTESDLNAGNNKEHKNFALHTNPVGLMQHQASHTPPPPPPTTTAELFTAEHKKPTKSSPANKFIQNDNVKEDSKRSVWKRRQLRQQLLNEKAFYQNNGNDDLNGLSKDLKDPDEDTEDGANEKPAKDTVPPLAFYKLFRYASRWELFLYFIGVLGAVATGLTIPANSLIFGNLANSMILFGDPDKPMDGASILLAVETFAIQNAIAGSVLLLCSYISVTAFNYAAHSQILTIRSRFFQSVLHQDMSWYDVHKSGEIASQMNEDLSKIEEGLGEKVVMFLHFIFAFIGCIALAFSKGWQLALVCLSSLPVTFIAMGIVGVATSKLAKKELHVYGVAGAIAEEALSNIRTVKAFEGEYKEINAYKEKIVDARNLNIKRSLLSGVGFGLLWFFIYASYALAFWYGVGLVLNNYAGDDYYSNYDPGTMIMIFFSVMMGSMNMGMASPYIEAFGIAKGAAAKVFKLIEQKPFINPIEKMGRQLAEPLNYIDFQNVKFYYPTRPDVIILDNFNLRIQRGETIALVGASGSGKSTCIQLLQRFYDTVDGGIYFNDLNLKEIDAKWLRSRIGVVGQEPILFGTSIYENIRYGLETATREDIEKAAKAANALRFIRKLPRGFETLVGERGAQLSGGQKQRIAIARALVRNPEILLLDEATSALDTSSEAKVQRALETASKGRTTIIVAHRLSTIFHADRIVVIQNGVVVESGSHSELMASQQHYYQLVMAQLREDDVKLNPSFTNTDSLSSARHDLIQDQAEEEDEDDEDIQFEMDSTEKQKTADKTEEAKFSIWSIIKLNKKEWPQILFGCFSSIINGFGMPLFALLFGSMLQVLAVRSDPVYIRENTNTLSLYLTLSGVATGMATFIQIFAFGIAGEKLTERLRGLMFEAMLKMEVAWFDERTNGTGTLCSRLSSDAAAIQGATGQRIGTVIQAMSTLGFALGLSMYYEWSLGLLALSFSPFILVATFLQRKIMAQENMGTAKTMEESTKLAVEVVSNIRTVNSLGREEMFHQKYINILKPAVAISKRNTHYRGFVYGLARSLMFYAYAACIYYGGWCVVNKDMEFGNVFKVSQAIIMGTTSIAGALAFAPNFQKGMSAAQNIYRLLTRQPQIVDSDLAKRTTDRLWLCDGNISFENVDFTYPTRSQIKVLRDLSCEFPKGQKIALVGPSGCGKSTCIQLIQRFYDVDSGKVAIDDYDVRHLRLETLRKQMGIVSQEPVLFDRTIKENIAYGDNNRAVNMIEIIDAAKTANIHNFISNLPLGYETRMGEKGTQISGGQKQRLAIARALIRNPKILLLDEATSALDSESEKIVQDALNAASLGRTTISIAHRLSTVMDSDQIFVIDNGKIQESGAHNDLMEMHGLYYSLYKLQSGM